MGLDVAPSQTAKAIARWGHLPGLEFTTAEAVDYLTTAPNVFDAVYSVFGAVWFTDPDVLLPLMRHALAPGGVAAFSHTAPADAGLPSPGARVRRYDLEGRQWGDLLVRHGFAGAESDVIDTPGGCGPRTLLVRAFV